MSLGEARWLLALLLVAALGVAMAVGATIRRRALTKAFGPTVLARVVPASVRVRRAVRDVAILAGLALTVVALAEPLYGERVFTMEREGIDMVLVLDLSRSMACTDVDPTRLQRMQREVYDLLDVVEQDDVGIVAFAGGAFPRLPLTEDHDAVRQVVGELDTNTFQTQGSALGAAIRDVQAPEERERLDAVFRSQQLWDWTMADAVVDALELGESPVVHVVGRFHVDHDGGTAQVLRKLRPGTKTLVVSFVDAWSDTLAADDASRGDFVIYVGPSEGE